MSDKCINTCALQRTFTSSNFPFNKSAKSNIGTIFRTKRFRNSKVCRLLTSDNCTIARHQTILKIVNKLQNIVEKSVRYIANTIGKSPTAVQNFIKRFNGNERKKKLGRPSTITPQFRRAIFRSVIRDPNERVTASRLVARYQPKVGIRRVQQLMQEVEHLPWTRIKSVPRLTASSSFDFVRRPLFFSIPLFRRTRSIVER